MSITTHTTIEMAPLFTCLCVYLSICLFLLFFFVCFVGVVATAFGSLYRNYDKNSKTDLFNYCIDIYVHYLFLDEHIHAHTNSVQFEMNSWFGIMKYYFCTMYINIQFFKLKYDVLKCFIRIESQILMCLIQNS